jgi:hypothetical protein
MVEVNYINDDCARQINNFLLKTLRRYEVADVTSNNLSLSSKYDVEVFDGLLFEGS